jgi:hypothetical protein
MLEGRNEMISAETVTQTWQRMAQTPIPKAPELVSQMNAEQPVLLAYLISAKSLPFNQNECQLVLYVGVVVWQIMKQSRHRLNKVTRKKMQKAERDNEKFLARLTSHSEDELVHLSQRLLAQYPEPEVLRYIWEAIMEEDPDPEEEPIREEYKGLAFIHLKVALDALINSLGPRRW